MSKEKHCCEQMGFLLEEDRVEMKYDSQLREYYIKLRNSQAVQGMTFCPWCGEKLPESLRDEFYDIIIDKLGLGGCYDEKLPEEFKTDEWWKKRGL